MAHWNGTEGAMMTAKPQQTLSPEDDPTSSLHVWVLRIWMVCALIIVVAGVANYLLCLLVGEK
jgi:hypothetical protein